MKNLIIDKGTFLPDTCSLNPSDDSKIIIGKYCAIADRLTIITLNHDPNYPAIQGRFYRHYFNQLHPGEMKFPPSKERTKGDVIIGNNVWIGADVFIASGVTIGDGAIIGAKSVITKNVEPYSLYCGNPATFKKFIFKKNIRDFLIELKWWNWDENKIKKNQEFFNTNLMLTDLNKLKDIIK